MRVLRTARKLSQEELARRSDLHINSIGLIEREQREPSLYTVSQLAIGLGISQSELVHSVAERNPIIRIDPGPD
ncbi:XRE family transcriptional regulator [Opitutaceae bacterium TAV4]|nr:XRE family transcriptional regulator [Opitutaceae bacterium TAV4]RRK01107.1 XRE family transcriptional regulator [Opitutaceae bacterium TAV3]